MKTGEKVERFIRERRLIGAGDTILLALSGGADSVYLLLILEKLRGELSFSLHAAHVQHGIRGKEAERDLEFSRELAERFKIPFHGIFVNVPEFSRKHHLGLEEGARLLRYRSLRDCLSEIMDKAPERAAGRGKIAVAQHGNDQAETVLYHLFRGSGLRGLRGMEAEKDGIIRPLLPILKEEILSELSERGIAHREDSTNRDLSYARNRIRERILPEAERLNAGALPHILRTAELIGEAEDLLLERAEEIFGKEGEELLEGGELWGLRISVLSLRPLRPILRRTLLLLMSERLSPGRKDWGAVHFDALDRLLFSGNGAHLDLPEKITADIRGKELRLLRHSEVLSMKGRKKR